MRFAFAQLVHLHRRLVGVDHAPAQDVALQGVHQRLQLHPTAAHPLGQCGSRNLHSRAWPRERLAPKFPIFCPKKARDAEI